MSIQNFKYDSAKGTMAFALVKSGIVPDERRLVSDKVEAIKPRYGFDKAPKVERWYITCTTEKEKEIMEMVPPENIKHIKSFRKHLKIAAVVAITYEKLCKALKTLKATEEEVVNEAYVNYLRKQVEKKEDQLAYHLDKIGANN